MTRSNKILSAVFNKFEGISAPSAGGNGAKLTDVLNFRVNENGCLEKRSGYKTLVKLTNTIRASWSGSFNGTFTCIFIYSNIVSSISPTSGAISNIGSIYSTVGSISIFHYENALYIKDQYYLYKVTDTIVKTTGYIPLYGKDWGTSFYGEVNEPLNILNRYARISYKVSSPYTAMLPTKHPVKSIIALYRNGSLVDSSGYEFDVDFNTINVQDISVGDTFLAYVEYTDATDETTAIFTDSAKTVVFGGGIDNRVCLWGSSTEPNSLLINTYVSHADLTEAKKINTLCDRLYFTDASKISVGDGKGIIKAVMNHYDKLLILTENNAWMTDSFTTGTNSFQAMNINSSVGCYSATGYTKAGSFPISIGKHGLYKWVYKSTSPGEFQAVCISKPISHYINSGYLKTSLIYYHASKNELWLCNPRDVGIAWIYNLSNDTWVRFSNIHSTGFFDANGNLGIYYNSYIFVFNDTLSQDNYVGTVSNVIGKIESEYLNFGSVTPKRLSSASVWGDIGENNVKLALMCETGEQVSYVAVADGTSDSSTRRLHSGRFRSLKLWLSVAGEAGQLIKGVKIRAKQKQ